MSKKSIGIVGAGLMLSGIHAALYSKEFNDLIPPTKNPNKEPIKSLSKEERLENFSKDIENHNNTIENSGRKYVRYCSNQYIIYGGTFKSAKKNFIKLLKYNLLTLEDIDI